MDKIVAHYFVTGVFFCCELDVEYLTNARRQSLYDLAKAMLSSICFCMHASASSAL